MKARGQGIARTLGVYRGSDGDATRALYAELQAMGRLGFVAMNVFRAQKASERAKVYRGGNGQGSYRAMAYGKKQWSIEQLDAALVRHGVELGLVWGWAEDPAQPLHRHVLYLELPTGQVSWHTETRGKGPGYAKPWDGARGAAPDRICRWIGRLIDQNSGAPPPERDRTAPRR